MDLKIKDVAELLNLSESTIRRWISEGKIPSYRINQHYLFSRTEIENWVISHKLQKNQEEPPPQHCDKQPKPRGAGIGTKSQSGSHRYSLFRAIHKGLVLHHLKGKTKEEVIRSAMQKSSKLLNVDAEMMAELLLDREYLMPTALNHGIAVPHTRDSLLSNRQDTIIVAFLDEPLPYGALDGEPVHTLFFLFACEDKRHLQLLAKIAHLSHQKEALEFLQTRPSKEALLSFIKEWEKAIYTQSV